MSLATASDGTTIDTSAEETGSETTPEQKPTEQVDPIALARKRQAGAEAARQKAQEERDNALKELETYRSRERSSEDQSLQDNAKLQERLAEAERRAEEAEVKAQGRILDALYPAARRELPEVTDEVRLAKFETLLSDTPVGEQEPPPPQNPNESNRTAGTEPPRKAKEESSEDILARLKSMGKPDWL